MKIIILTLSLLTTMPAMAQAQPDPNPAELEKKDQLAEEFKETGFREIQPESIRFSFVNFNQYEYVKAVQDQMYSIPGVTDFIPRMSTPGLITYDLRYSGPAKLLMKALRDVFKGRYDLGMKELGKKSWEITMRKHGGMQ